MPVKILNIFARETVFLPVKKNQKVPVKKITRVKKVEKPEKNGREK